MADIAKLKEIEYKQEKYLLEEKDALLVLTLRELGDAIKLLVRKL